jgi:hypothetical protein
MFPNFKNKTRVRSLTQIEAIYEQSLQYRIGQAQTPTEKRAIVVETNPFFYVFGEHRKVFKPYLTYGENFNVEIN